MTTSPTEVLIQAQKAALATQPHLAMQDIEIDVATLTPLTPQIISRQATINIGTIGHVAHGKSTLVRAISGVNVSLLFPTLSTLPNHESLMTF